jgi:hypothetical protein
LKRTELWPNRDPIGENGFEVVQFRGSKILRVIAMLERIGRENSYEFVHNQSIGIYDPLGLAPVTTGPPGGGGGRSAACESAIEQMEAADAMRKSEPSPENTAAWAKAVLAAIKACSPPPDDPPDPQPAPKNPPWCPAPRWNYPYTPPPPNNNFWIGVGVGIGIGVGCTLCPECCIIVVVAG